MRTAMSSQDDPQGKGKDAMAGLRRGAILIVIDGCRSDALSQASVPNIDRMRQGGASTIDARTVVPPITLPVHFSIFSSVQPVLHGVRENCMRPVPSPGIVTIPERVKNSGGRACAFFNWEPLRDLAPAGCQDHLYFLANLGQAHGDLEIAAAAAAYTVRNIPDFVFVYLGNVDMAGHDHGFMSREYLKTLQTADVGVGMILKALSDSGLADHYNIVLQSDHGGVDRSHHDPLPEVVTIPWLACGPDVRAGLAITSPVTVLDTAPTLARLLNMDGHETWQGRVVEELFKT
jgi:predicted AlkP superfamily pyrophosphatase or phosphodiesterase